MKGIAKRSVVTTFAALAVAVTAFAFANPAVAQGQAQGSAPVTIVGPLPVPVTGAVSGTVAISNTPLPVVGTVGLTSGTVVTIGNTATNPVIVQTTSGREPFQARTIGAGNDGASVVVTTVPSGKMLVIEHASASINMGSSTQFPASVAVGVDLPALVNDLLPCHPMGANALNHNYSCSVQTKIYAAAGSTVRFSVGTLFDAAANMSFTSFVSGYYVDTP